MPISVRRCPARCAITPYRPTAASTQRDPAEQTDERRHHALRGDRLIEDGCAAFADGRPRYAGSTPRTAARTPGSSTQRIALRGANVQRDAGFVVLRERQVDRKVAAPVRARCDTRCPEPARPRSWGCHARSAVCRSDRHSATAVAASERLTMATRGAVGPSAIVKSRPRRIGMPQRVEIAVTDDVDADVEAVAAVG